MKIIYTLTVLLLIANKNIAQQGGFYLDSAKNFHIILPKGWKSEKPLYVNEAFRQVYETKGKSYFYPYLRLLTTNHNSTTHGNSLEEYAAAELKLILKRFRNKPKVLINEILISNNKLWWSLKLDINMNLASHKYCTMLQTLHNNKVYMLEYAYNTDDPAIALDEAWASISSFMFRTSDNAMYKDKPVVNQVELNAVIEKHAGRYEYTSAGGTATHIVILGNAAGNRHSAKEIRTIKKDGSVYNFEAELTPVYSSSSQHITLSTDAILRYDTIPNFNFLKASYSIAFSNNGARADFFAADKKFETYSFDLNKINPVVAKVKEIEKTKAATKPLEKATVDNKKNAIEAVSNSFEEPLTDPVASRYTDPCDRENLKKQKWSSCLDLSAVEKVKLFGRGKVKLLLSKKPNYGGPYNDNTYEITLTNGVKQKIGPLIGAKKLPNGNIDSDYTITDFFGIDDNAQAFVFGMGEQESSWVILVSLHTGKVIGKVDWPNDGDEKDFSPNKKFLLTYINGLAGNCLGGCKYLQIYEMGNQVKSVFTYYFSDDKDGQWDGDEKTIKEEHYWFPGAYKWINNTVIEIEKLKIRKGKKHDPLNDFPDDSILVLSDKVWIVNVGGKWKMVDENPVKKEANTFAAAPPSATAVKFSLPTTSNKVLQ